MKARYKWLMILGGLILYFLMMVEDSNYDRLYDQNRELFYSDRRMGWRIDELEESIAELQAPIPEHKKFRKDK